MHLRIYKVLIALSFFFSLGCTHSFSLPLSSDECTKLRSEQKILTDIGVTDDISKGYKNASGNLSKDRLLKIKRWFELESLVQFRCSKSKTLSNEKSATKEVDKKNSKELKALPNSKIDAKNTTNTARPSSS